LLGVSADVFHAWLAGQQGIPRPYIHLLSSVLGARPSDIAGVSRAGEDLLEDELAPAVWFKLRSDELFDADRECVFAIRQLGFYLSQFEAATGQVHAGWEEFFRTARGKVDSQAPPLEQGRQAARVLKASRGLPRGTPGVGDIFRPNLRSIGILVVESPIPHSQLEGCTFFVGAGGSERPCIFANTYGSTWFRRNTILLHELGHAIFEGEGGGVSIDLSVEPAQSSLQEVRAQAFAEEFLLPAEALRHLVQSRGIDWTALTEADLAFLIANSDAEQKLVLKVARRAGFISQDLQEKYSRLQVSKELHLVSERALTANEYLERRGLSPSAILSNVRGTTTTGRSLRLPVKYVLDVVEALRNDRISAGKAAELLMIEKHELFARFPDAAELAMRP
jgi:Zn-dependent peptidase ImmA (M78 family)